MHLGFDDVDAGGGGVADGLSVQLAVALQVVNGGDRRDHAVENALEDLVAFPVQHGGVGHQVADIAHEQHTAALQGQW